MNNFLHISSIAIGASLGGLLRYYLTQTITHYATLFFVNGLGCFLMGFLFYYTKQIPLSTLTYQTLTIGFLGALTTFSGFALEWWKWHESSISQGIGYLIAMNSFCIISFLLGFNIIPLLIK